MTPIDSILIDPTPEQLLAAVVSAVAAANSGLTDNRLEEGSNAWAGFVAETRNVSEGVREWIAGGRRERSRLVRVAWWADQLARWHYRIVARERTLEEALGDRSPVAEHALAQVYPQVVVLRQRAGSEDEHLVVCGCGASGTPASLGWMGDCCGPCYDRREEGSLAETNSRTWFRNDGGYVRRLAFIANETLIALLGGNGVRVWNLTDGRNQSLPVPDETEKASERLISPDGKFLLLVAPSEFILLDLARGESRKFPRHAPGTGWDATPPDGNRLVISTMISGYERCVLINLAPSFTSRPLNVDGRLAFSPTARYLYTAHTFGEVARVDLETDETIRLPADDPSVLLGYMDESSLVSGLVCSSDGRWLAVSCWGDYGGGFRVHDVPTGQWSHLLPKRPHSKQRTRGHEHSDLGSDLAISPASSTLAVGGKHGLVSFWDLPDRELGRLRWDGSWLMSMVFSPDGDWLAVGDHQGVIRLLPWRRLLELP